VANLRGIHPFPNSIYSTGPLIYFQSNLVLETISGRGTDSPQILASRHIEVNSAKGGIVPMGGTTGSAEPLGSVLVKGRVPDSNGVAKKAGGSTVGGVPTPRRRASEKLEKPDAEEVGREGEVAEATIGDSDTRGRGEGLEPEF